MTRGQRWIILIGVPLVAWMLHTTLCEWHYKTTNGGRSNYYVLLCYEHADPVTVPVGPAGNLRGSGGNASNIGNVIRGRQTTVYSGLFPDGGVSRVYAALFGVILPLIMLAATAWLWLGWRRADRITNGLCTSCAHDLRGVNHDKCPECGAPCRA